jgi:hypothetical protein
MLSTFGHIVAYLQQFFSNSVPLLAYNLDLCIFTKNAALGQPEFFDSKDTIFFLEIAHK